MLLLMVVLLQVLALHGRVLAVNVEQGLQCVGVEIRHIVALTLAHVTLGARGFVLLRCWKLVVRQTVIIAVYIDT